MRASTSIRRGIVHGRLQPDKIIFAGLSPVLLDVRVNRVATPYRTNRPPTPSEVSLMAPELLTGSLALTPHTDLYALGATLYLALTGRPPLDGTSIGEVSGIVAKQRPPSPASIVMECPVWFDKLVMQLLEESPSDRPHGAAAVSLALAEVRRRSMSRAGVAEHASAGFSPLNVTDQKERDEARALLGHAAREIEDHRVADATDWHDRPWVLIAALVMFAGLFTYFAWPLSEIEMRRRTEALLAQDPAIRSTRQRPLPRTDAGKISAGGTLRLGPRTARSGRDGPSGTRPVRQASTQPAAEE